MSHASGWYQEGAVLNITWTPPSPPPLSEKDVFFRWKGTGNGSYTGRGFVATVTVNGPIEEIAECLCMRSDAVDIVPKRGEREIRTFPPFAWGLTDRDSDLDCMTAMSHSELLCPPKSSILATGNLVSSR